MDALEFLRERKRMCIAMDLERYGDCKVMSIVSDRGREEQLRMKGAKL